MATSSKSATKSRTQSGNETGVGELVGEIVRNAAGEAVKGGSFGEATKRIVSDAVVTLDERGPDIAKNAGVMTWRYALLGWATWNVGKFVVKRRARKTVKSVRRKATPATRRT